MILSLPVCMTTRTRSIPAQLKSAKVGITNALGQADILAALTPYSYTNTKLTAGLALLTAAETAVTVAANRLGQQKAATVKVVAARKALRDSFQDLAKVARAIFANDEAALGLMGLDVPMPLIEADLIVAARTLFTVSPYTPAMITVLDEHGFDTAWFTAARDKVDVLVAFNEAQADAIGAYETAAAAQKTALEELAVWFACFVKIARVALKGNRQWMERLGIVARTFPTRAQVKGKAKARATRAAKKLAQLPEPEAQAA